MTSEKKEAFLNSWFDVPEGYHWSHGMANQIEQEVSEQFDEAMQAYTRAVPDVPELVRYEPAIVGDFIDSFGMEEIEDGDYVRYDQAAAVVAAKDAEQRTWRGISKHHTGYQNPTMAFITLIERAEAAEAELAEIKAQEPVACQWQTSSGGWIECTKLDAIRKVRIGKHQVRYLYASPAPCPDLKAENERLRKSLEFYADTSKYPAPFTGGMGALWSDCGEVAKKALKGEGNV